ncbi:hypothetical protein EVAR_13762_1 [Eumeta japonica]|uniref:Uncharacterized protein n=1 Tax=Eumeta variegata TaxID=151549 RepID=A0A4C1U2D7_EUMVA|nr:hypothetical protein EVAR_13762_1 [Eumeta japonica]
MLYESHWRVTSWFTCDEGDSMPSECFHPVGYFAGRGSGLWRGAARHISGIARDRRGKGWSAPRATHLGVTPKFTRS